MAIVEATPAGSDLEGIGTLRRSCLPLGAACANGHHWLVPVHRFGKNTRRSRPIKTFRLVYPVCGLDQWQATIFEQLHEVEALGRSATATMPGLKKPSDADARQGAHWANGHPRKTAKQGAPTLPGARL